MVNAGYEVSRSQLLAALVTNAPKRPGDLERLVREYKKGTAGTVVLQSKGAIREQERKPRAPREPHVRAVAAALPSERLWVLGRLLKCGHPGGTLVTAGQGTGNPSP